MGCIRAEGGAGLICTRGVTIRSNKVVDVEVLKLVELVDMDWLVLDVLTLVDEDVLLVDVD